MVGNIQGELTKHCSLYCIIFHHAFDWTNPRGSLRARNSVDVIYTDTDLLGWKQMKMNIQRKIEDIDDTNHAWRKSPGSLLNTKTTFHYMNLR